MDHMTVMEQPVQDRRGEHLVSGKHLRPFPDALVRRDDCAGPFVPDAHYLEQKMGIASVQSLEPEFVDDKDPGRQVLPSFVPPGGVLLVPPETLQEVVGGKPRDGEDVLESLDSQSRRVLPWGSPDSLKEVLILRSSRYSRSFWRTRSRKSLKERLSFTACSMSSGRMCCTCSNPISRLKNEMFYNRKWFGVGIAKFLDILNRYLHWYNEQRIKMSLGAMSSLEHRRSLNLAA